MKDTSGLGVIKRRRKVSTTPTEGPREGHVRCLSKHGFHNVAYRDWGDREAKEKVFCVHGLTRNSHDYDALAAAMSKTRRVVCPDLPGRGRSDRLRDPEDYNIPQYNVDMTTLAARFRYREFTWIGTSLGALMGMSLAGIENSPIKRLIVNDVAPNIPYAALSRITSYMGTKPIFKDLEGVEGHLRKTLKPFAPMTDQNWKDIAVNSSILTDNGYIMHHDPAIMENFNRYWVFMHFSLWKYWEKIECPVLILRGTESDFLTRPLLDKMIEKLPHAEFIEFEGAGHTPTLNAPEQIDPILAWLEKTDPVAEL